MEDTSIQYHNRSIKSIKSKISDKFVPTQKKYQLAKKAKEHEMSLRNRENIEEDAPVNSVGNGAGISGIVGGAAPAGKPANWNEPGMPRKYVTKYAKKNAENAPKGPVMEPMAKRTPLQSFREFIGK
jgi:hypothetical protein